jgi:hypothetical protein
VTEKDRASCSVARRVRSLRRGAGRRTHRGARRIGATIGGCQHARSPDVLVGDLEVLASARGKTLISLQARELEVAAREGELARCTAERPSRFHRREVSRELIDLPIELAARTAREAERDRDDSELSKALRARAWPMRSSPATRQRMPAAPGRYSWHRPLRHGDSGAATGCFRGSTRCATWTARLAYSRASCASRTASPKSDWAASMRA